VHLSNLLNVHNLQQFSISFMGAVDSIRRFLLASTKFKERPAMCSLQVNFLHLQLLFIMGFMGAVFRTVFIIMALLPTLSWRLRATPAII
jgi:hypothetical protein